MKPTTIKLNLLLPLLLLILTPEPVITTIPPAGLRVHLTHVDSGGNFTKLERIQRATKRSRHRISRLTSAVSSAAAAVHAGDGEFLVDLAIGSPAAPFSAIVDTGSDLIWTQCKPCVQCFDQPAPIFDPSGSSTFSKLACSASLCEALPVSTCSTSTTDCDYLYEYGDSSSTQGLLASDTFTFNPDTKNPVSVPGVGFGCGDTNQGAGFTQASGLVGLGRGPLSLISQMGVGKFSYCLTSLDESSKKSPLLLGATAAEVNGTSTPLVRNPNQASFYYLSLKGITVGGTLLDIPTSTFELGSDGTGGLIIDSGTSITYLEAAGYRLLKKAFVKQMELPVADGSNVGLDLCFSLPATSTSTEAATSVEVPKLVFHFDGGADVELPPENYMVVDSGLMCLAVLGSEGMSIFGNFQQQNMQIVYDLEKDTLTFIPTSCNQL